ncbi:MAG: Rab family GTPase [Candidatus Saliniplasma sp.]
MYYGKVKKKVNLLGNPAVGKTSLILRFVKDVFGEKYLKTIGTSFYAKDVEVVGASVKLIIQDVMGEKSYEAVHKSTFRWSSGAIFVADATRKETLDDIFTYWIPKYKDIAGQNNPIVLAVNKMDLDDLEITKDQALKEAHTAIDHVLFTSAKTGKGVDNAFHELASMVLFNMPKKAEGLDQYLSKQSLVTPKDLLGGLFILSSSLEDLDYSELENMFNKSDIDRFGLEKKVPEKKVLSFAGRIKRWCESEGNKSGVKKIDSLIKRYKE